MHRFEAILENIRKKGLRDSKIKRKVIEYLLKANKPLSIGEIIELLDQEEFRFNKTSLYRETDKLLKGGFITEIDFLDGKKRYEINTGTHHHHAICTKCKKIVCVEIPNNLEEVEKKLFQDTQFKVEDHVLEFFGTCKECSK